MDFGRLITAMVTPFGQDLAIDWEQTGKLLDYLIDEQQSDSLVICGTTGEAPTLSVEEKLELFEFAVKRAAGRCKIIANTGDNETSHSVQLTKEADKLGVDGVLLVAPYYNRPTQAGMYEHFKACALATTKPVMLYNVPKRTGVTIQAETIIKLSAIDNIVATKEAHGDLDLITSIVAGTDESFKVYSGDDILTLPMMAVGAHGVVSVASHVRGREIKQMMNAFLQGNVKEAAQQHIALQSMFNGLFVAPNPVPTKHALNHLGLQVGGVRLPLVEATEDEKRFVESLFQ